MFGFFKKEKKLVIDYEFSSRVASTLEGFLIHCAQNWDKPAEHLKKYALNVYPQGHMSISLKSVDKNNDDALYVIDLGQIKKIDTITKSVVSMRMPGPFVNPLISLVSDEIVDNIRRLSGSSHAQHP